MCEPILFGTAASAATGSAATAGLFGVGGSFALAPTLGTLGTLFSAYGAYSTAQNNAAMANQQAAIYEQQRQDALKRGEAEEEAHRRKVAQFAGTQRSQLAANGVELDSGSASDLQADTAMLGELDALTIRNNAAREAWGYAAQANTSKAEASNYRRSGLMTAGGTLLGGFGGQMVNTKWYSPNSVAAQQAAFNASPLKA